MNRFFTGSLALLSFLWLGLGVTLPVKADTSGDWSIQNFHSDIQVNSDSSLSITEYITANCPGCVDKHGIFRVLPTENALTSDTTHRTPIYLNSITDFNGVAYPYTTSTDGQNHTISWQIGDLNKTVQGINNYKISYTVKNAILSSNASFDELYWNLNGNFWDIPIDAYQAVITFPASVTAANSTVNLYSGDFKAQGNSYATSSWNAQNQLVVTSTTNLGPDQGITVSVTQPKGIYTPYTLTAAENQTYNPGGLSDTTVRVIDYSGIALPIIIFIICFLIWRRYGRDPKGSSIVAPVFDIPDNRAPIEMGLIYTNGILSTTAVTAAIVNLGVKGFLTISILTPKSFITKATYTLTKLKEKDDSLAESERLLFDGLFAGRDSVTTPELTNKFFLTVLSIKRQVISSLVQQKLLDMTGTTIRNVGLIILAVLLFTPFSFTFFALYPPLLIGALVSIVILIIFLLLMPRRTPEGLAALRDIKGYMLYLKTAEKYRAKFLEQENVFERYLPYAILFGVTGLWAKAFSTIYGEQQAGQFVPIWFIGGNFGGDFGSFTTSLNDISTSIGSAAMSSPSSSGSGGGGFSGGGGGGGGGGGW